jgi:hypothetical protein
MFRYELEDGRPSGRTRTFPAIEATPYSKRIPERQMKISRTEYTLEWIRYLYVNAPSPGEATVWLWYHSPYIILAGALAVGVADETFDLHIAEEMAQVQVDENAWPLEQVVQEIIHDIGETVIEER